MSSWIRNYKHTSGEIHKVFAIDDYFGSHIYGFKLPDGRVLRVDDFEKEYEEIKDVTQC